MMQRIITFALLVLVTVNGFTPTPSSIQSPSRSSSSKTTTTFSPLVCFDEKKKKGGLDEGMRNKLVSESIAPWRTIRLFLYGSLGSGAFIGGLINGR